MYEKKTLIEIFKAMKANPQTHWRLHDVLKAFTDEFCEVTLLPH
jgi:hypothetical protein